MKNKYLVACSLLFIIITCIRCADNDSNTEWKVNDLEYLETPGFNVLVFHDYYPEGKQGGIEFIHHDERVATNGYLSVDLPDGRSFPRPEKADRTVDLENNTITAKVSTPDFDLDYSIRIRPENKKVHLIIDLEKPIPEEWKDRVTFDLLFYPVAYRGKTYQLGNNYGVFPVEGLGPMSKNSMGQLKSIPMATGRELIIAPEDEALKLKIESLTDELSLTDGRNTSLGGWFILSTTIPEGVTTNAMEWIISPNLIKGWIREPVIGISQVGYHPDQVKRAIIELDKRTGQLEKAVLSRINQDGTVTPVYSGVPVGWGNFLRYIYTVFDFTDISDPGLYQVSYGTKSSEPFIIDRDVYQKSVWQPTLEIYFPVQMCHMRIRDRVRVWHGACHLDDALQAPLAIEHTDGYRSYAVTETDFRPMTTVPGLNRGGWHDAGDNDLAAGSQAQTTFFLALADETFNIDVDQTTVDQEDLFVEVRHPDGIQDLEQQIEHGVINLLSGYRASGHSFAGIIATREGRAFLGDVASLTDHLFYDASLKPDEIRNGRSGKADDRWVFTNKDTGLEYEVITALAAASRILRGYNDDLAEECLQTAIKAWNFEQNHDPVIQPNAYVPRDYKSQEILATSELLITTRENIYKERLTDLLPVIKDNIDRVGWSVVRAKELIDNGEFINAMEEALQSYKSELDSTLSENPFGVPWNPRVWGIGWNIQQYALQQYYLSKAYPDIFDRENILRVVNYVLGCHPGSNTSFVSGIGAHSLTVAYGFNMHWWSYIPGGMASGTALIRPDFPELKEPFPFLWQQTEYVMPGAASYIFCVLAADNLLNK